jgi:hypothetical protein
MDYVETPTKVSQRSAIAKLMVTATQLHLYTIMHYRPCVLCKAARPCQQYVRIRIGPLLQRPQYPICGFCHERIIKRRAAKKAKPIGRQETS